MWKPQGIYADYILYQPTIFFGEDAVRGLSTLPGARIAVISGDSLRRETKELLFAVFKKKSLYFIERSWDGEPDLAGLQESVSQLETIRPDVIIAVGGGSVIDGTKLCRLFYEFPYYKIDETKLAQLSFKTRFVAIPTTVGSGAEASSAAVFFNTEEGRKEMIVDHNLQPSVVVLAPEYVRNAPERVIVSSMLDAVGHIVEGYVSKRYNGLADICAEKALSILYREFMDKRPDERDYQRIQYAGYMGGIVQNHCIVGAAHAVAHQLAGYGFPHGEAVALLLPEVIRINSEEPDVKDRYEILCARAEITSVSDLLEFIESKLEETGIIAGKEKLKKTLYNLKNKDQFILNVMNDMGGKGNPIPITKDYLDRLIGVYL